MSKTEERRAPASASAQIPIGNRRGGPAAAILQQVEKPSDLRSTLVRLYHYLREEKKPMAFLLLAVCMVLVCSLFIPWLQGEAVDMIVARRFSGLRGCLLFLLLAYLVTMAGNLVQSRVAVDLGQSIVRKMRQELFAKINRLPIAYMDSHSKGDVMSRMTYDVENIATSVSQSLGSLVSGTLMLVGTTAIMMYLCWQLTLISMGTVIATMMITKMLAKVMRRNYKRKSEYLGQLNGHSEEMINGCKTIASYNRQDDVVKEFDELSEKLTRAGIRSDVLSGCMGPITGIIFNSSFVVVAAFGGWFALEGMITLGTIASFIIYVKQFTRPINEIAQLYGTMQTAIAGAERVFEVLDQPDENRDGAAMPEGVRGEVTFEHVDFSYLPGKPVLHDFNLSVHPGEKIALVGATGSGKTTVVNLLMRFYPLDSGTIRIDGKDIMDLDRDWLRQNVAIVLQDTVLFSDTIAGNIKYANQEADDTQMIYAARMSNSAPFIELLPKQYQTFLTHAGASLSQGERQLLNIARAILADPRILVLDEATSSVDTRTEKNIQDAMANLMKDRTSLIIAHRLSTIQDADRIIVMDAGHIVEMGSHEELLAQKGKYYTLYMQQFSGYQT